MRVRGFDEAVTGILQKLADVKLPRIAVLNKVDKLEDKGRLLDLVGELQTRLSFEQAFMICHRGRRHRGSKAATLLRALPPRLRGTIPPTVLPARPLRRACSPRSCRARRSSTVCTGEVPYSY